MTQATGSRSYLAYVAETVAGTTPATPALKGIPFQNTSLNLTRGLVTDPSLRSDRQKRYSRLGNRMVGGNIVVSYAPNTFDELLESVFLSSWTTDVLKIGVTPKSFTFEIGHPDISQYRTFTGVTAGGFTLNVPSGNTLVTGEFTMMGTNGAIGSATVDAAGGIEAPVEGDPFVHLDATFLEGGVSIGYLTGVQIEIQNQLTANYAAGSPGARSITAGMATVTGQITAYFESAALFTKWLAETDSSLKFTLTVGADSQEWFLPKVQYSASTIPVANDGPIIQTLTFEALYDSVTGSVVQVTRVNA